MKTIKKIVNRTYGLFAAISLLTAFAALFARSLKFSIPIVSTAILPFLDRYAIRVNTIQGPATVMRGEHWFFAIILGVVIVAGIAVAVINNTVLKK